ncbi:hypothetical protein Q5762_18625 [Streptomyces sp. P9(2023)]|uniref:hypothetical protein n=1 Tax=Streptomyces sp. P9(2023) TaxID=3064394 RepID=UPI0028F408A9|nr:hypothetical protein [Streptomyces sp. P9(2023)]MDT9690317.1 hypothetical protein [Streptomyces sp. P9(2023)]
MTTRGPWARLGALGLLPADVTARYLLTYAAAFGALALFLDEPGYESYWTTGLKGAPSIAVPSVVILWIFGLASRRTGVMFRWQLAWLLLLPLWPLLFASTPVPLLTLRVSQTLFAAALTRAPLVPADWR